MFSVTNVTAKLSGLGYRLQAEWIGTPMKNFRDLHVWRKSHALALMSYKCTAHFPRNELYGVTSQIRRCAASVSANIAEGCGKRGNAEFQRFLGIAAGSASELEYHFLLARDLELLSLDTYEALNSAILEVKRMLAGLILKVEHERQGHLNAEC
jgi:four helix bundle protein